MSRPAGLGLALVALVAAPACFDFQGLIDDCTRSRGTDGGLCGTPDDGGAAGGGSGGGTGGGSAGPIAAYCDAGAATLRLDGGGTAFCFNGFLWASPTPQGNELNTVWGSAPNDVWAAGYGSMLMHFDGVEWTSWQGAIPGSGALRTLDVVAGLSPTNVLVAAVTGLYAFDGSRWSKVGAYGVVRGVATTPAAGGRIAVVTENGCTVLDAGHSGPAPTRPFPGYKDVAFDSSGEAAVLDWSAFDCAVYTCSGVRLGGSSIDAGGCGPMWWTPDGFQFAANGVVTRIDGGEVVTGLPPLNHNASAFDDGTGWLVGGTELRELPLGTFTQVDYPSTLSLSQELEGVWASPDGGSWVVGYSGLLVRQASDGTWAQQSGGANVELFGASVDEGDVVVGRDDLFWRLGSDPQSDPAGSAVRDVWRSPTGVYWMVNEGGRLFTPDGGGPGDVGGELHGLWGTSDTDLFVVGDDGVGHWDGGTVSWVPEVPADAGTFWKVHGRDGWLWAVGDSATLAERDPAGQWRLVHREASGSIYSGVWLEDGDAGTGWVVAGNTPIRVSAHGTLTPTAGLGTGNAGFFDVWGFDPNDVWAVGSDGLIAHSTNGSSFVAVESGTRTFLERVRGRELGGGWRELLIVGQSGTILRYRYQR